MKKPRLNKLVLINISNLEYENGKHYGKNAVVKYSNEMSKSFDSTIFITTITDGRLHFKTEIEHDDITVIRTGYNKTNTIVKNVFNLICDQYILFKNINKQTAIVYNSPDLWFFPVLPLLRLKCGKLVCYMTSNPWGTAKLLKKSGGFIGVFTSFVYIVQAVSISILCDHLFVCGNPILYRKFGNKVVQSKLMLQLEPISGIDERYGLQRNEIRILYVGELNSNKGIEILIMAFSNILKSNLEANLILELRIVGDGPSRKKLEELVYKLDCDQYVRFMGYIDDSIAMSKQYLDSNVLVVPSIVTEGSPRVIDEAMYYGTPVIATDMNYGDIYSNGQNIILVAPGNVGDLEKAIIKVLFDKNLRNILIQNGVHRMNQIMADSVSHQHSNAIFN